MKTVSCESCGSNELIELGSGKICAFCRAQFVEDPQIFAPDGKIAGYACARCGLVDRVTLYGARYTTQENAAQIYLGDLESWEPCALFGDPLPNDFDSQKSVLDEVMACDRCACLTYKGVEIEPGEFCESTFGSFGMLRVYEHWAVGEYLANATFGTSIERREFQFQDSEFIERKFNMVVDRIPFDSKSGTVERYTKNHGSTTVSIACGQTGSQGKAQTWGALKPSVWPTTTLLSAMWSADSDSSYVSMISTSTFSTSGSIVTAGAIRRVSSVYEKKFQELSGFLDV